MNVLTNDKGRIVDVVHHVVTGPGTILLVGHRKSADDLIAWLDRYCFSEQASFAAHDGACVLADAVTAEGVVPGAATLAPWAAVHCGDVIAVRTFDRVDADGAIVAMVLLLAPSMAELPAPTMTDDDDAIAAMAAGVLVQRWRRPHAPRP